MQTLHLRFRALRAISSGQSPSRWQTPSMRCASKWKGAPPLPNLPRPTCAVGSRPVTSPQQFAQCPTVGAGLPLASPFREAWIVGPDGADPRRVCPRQPACHLSPYPAPHEAGDLGADDRQARASESRWLASGGLSFPLRPQRSGARAGAEKTVVQKSDSSGTLRSEATGFRPTGRLDHDLLRKRIDCDPTSSCADNPALVTGQMAVGVEMLDVSHPRCARARLCLCREGC